MVLMAIFYPRLKRLNLEWVRKQRHSDKRIYSISVLNKKYFESFHLLDKYWRDFLRSSVVQLQILVSLHTVRNHFSASILLVFCCLWQFGRFLQFPKWIRSWLICVISTVTDSAAIISWSQVRKYNLQNRSKMTFSEKSIHDRHIF